MGESAMKGIDMKRHNRELKLFFFLGVITLFSATSHAALGTNEVKNPVAQEGKEAKKVQVQEAYGQLPLSFIRNDGQVDKKVKFYEKGSGRATFFTKEGVYLSLTNGQSSPTSHSSKSTLIRLTPLGANKNPKIVAEGLQEGQVNYFVGNDPKKWQTNISTHQAVVYQDIYPGIDLKFYGNNRQMEYDIVVKPGADPSKVKLGYEGIEGLRVTDAGDLEIKLKGGTIFQKKPIIYQEIEGKRVDVAGTFKIQPRTNRHAKNFAYGFEVSSYDKAHPLLIDPTLVYSTYLGGSGDDAGFAIAVDASGNAYVTGQNGSSNFPTAFPLQATYGGGEHDAFVAKINAAGNALIYSTYLGGSGEDVTFDIAVDGSGNAYVTGRTYSTNFPTANPFQAANAGNADAFVTKLNAAGALVYSTYLGGSGGDQGNGIAVDASGNAYVTGAAASSDFPTVNPIQATFAGGCCEGDAFVAKLNAAGSALVYSTYLGGSGFDDGLDIAVDASGNAYVRGRTASSNFPTVNPIQATFAGGFDDAFVTKLNAAGSALVYSTYLGGSGNEGFGGIAVDASGNAYVAGSTASSNFPTVNPIQATLAGSFDVFVTKFNAAGSALVYSTYLGGSGEEGTGYVSGGVAVDASGNAYVAGTTRSTNFPMVNPLQATLGGGQDAFVTKLNAAGSALLYSTYLGGSSSESATAIAVDASGNVYVTGGTTSSDFPTVNPYQATNGGGSDVFVTKIGPPSLTSIAVTPADPTINVSDTQPFTATGTFSDGSSRVLTSGSGTWATKASMPTARTQLAAGVVNGTLYAVGGTDWACNSYSTLEAYDPITNTWTTKAPMPTPRGVPSADVVNGILYVIGGETGCGTPILDTVEAYDPTTNTWTTKAPMSTPRFDPGTSVINGLLYAVGGYNSSNGNLDTIEAYDPTTNAWTTKAPMLTARDGLRTGVINGILYAVGGFNSAGAVATVEAYDPATDSWTTKTSMPTARGDLAVEVVNGLLYAVGGQGNSGILATVEAYDPTTNTWTTMTSMPTARTDLAGGAINGRTIYAVGGCVCSSPPSRLATVEAYAPPEIIWSSGNTGVATIDQTGLATGLSAGTTTITATSGSISGSTTLTVVSPNQPPVAISGGPYVTDLGAGVTLNGTGSFDPNACCGDSIVSYAWSIAGGTLTLSGATPSLTAAQVNTLGVGTFPIVLTVTDSFGATGTSSATLRVYDNRPFASFTATPNPAACGQQVRFDASSSGQMDPRRSIVSYMWDFGDSGTATGVVASHSYGAFGSYNATLTVTDDNVPPKTATSMVVINVNQGNMPPVAQAGGPYTVVQGNNLTLDGSASSDPNTACGDTIVRYDWDLGNDGSVEYSGVMPTIPWSALASLPVGTPVALRLRVTDSFSAYNDASTTITVLQMFTLSLTTAGTGSGSVSGAGSYTSGQTATVSATANVGSTFSGWTGPNAAECTTGSVTMTANKSCTATFIQTQVITFGALGNKTYGDAPFTVSATGGASGNPVTFTAVPAGVCSSSGINGSTITIGVTGLCTVTAHQVGNSDYNAAADLPQSFTVAPKGLDITANNRTKTYGDTVTFAGTEFTTGAGQLVNGDTVTSVTLTSAGAAATATVGGSPYAITPSAAVGTGLGNYTISYHAAGIGLTVAPKGLDITATNDGKTYGQTKTYGAGSTAFSSVGLQNSETIGSVTLSSTGAGSMAAVGSYPIVAGAATGGTFSAANYDIHYHDGTLTVNPAMLDITPDGGKSKVYGETFTAFTGSVVGLKNSDAVAVTYASTGAAAAAAAGSDDITVAGYSFTVGAASNYDIHTHTAANGLTVNKATLTVTAENKTKLLNAPLPPLTAAITGFKNGETLATSGVTGSPSLTTTATATSPVGSYPITAALGTLASNNYSFIFVNGTLLIQYATSGTCGDDYGHRIRQPINDDHSSVFKQKSTVPAKFRVCDANGVSIGTPGVVANFRLIQIVSGTVVDTVDEAVDSTTPDASFRWDSTGQQWIFNMSTKSLSTNVTYFYQITLSDSSTINFNFGLK
jgi:hypothetical protein